MDNNAAERAIRPFCVGKKNWKLIDTIHGAEASAIIYSIVETCKLNNLNIFYYISHLLTEIPKHMDDTNLDFLEDLLPWSEKLPEECKKRIAEMKPGFPNNHTSIQESSNNYCYFWRASNGLTPRSRYSCSCFIRTSPCAGAFPGSR